MDQLTDIVARTAIGIIGGHLIAGVIAVVITITAAIFHI